ncbi:N-acetylmuramoyl-L-alanine amidase [Sneathiella sp.]|uniref:N-acetylmuramoyl-L-alanine amidase n=1 Tax=Sneathiella sp. TaxID=1964365 RepID=UPI003568255B
MFNRFFRCVLLTTLLCMVSIAPGFAAKSPVIDVTSVRLGLHKDKTRFVLEMSEKPDVSVFLLAEPYRIVIDLPELNWQADDSAPRQKGVIQNYRYGLFKKHTSRVVLDVDGPVRILRSVILPPAAGKPYRFFIDIQRTDQASFMTAVRERRKEALAKEVAMAPQPPVQTPSGKKHIVIIDAGHGGIDPGAIGQSGVFEKIITLGVAQKLNGILAKNPAYHPIMTRNDDTFLSLRERVAVARGAGADLFISIHADSISRPDFRGATVYTLSETASDDEAAEIAHTANRSDLIGGVDLSAQDDTVQGILIDLAQRETMNFSVKVAEMIIPEIAKSGMKTRGRSHRFAGFRVLKAPDVPSVLVELGYLSNREDEKILKSQNGQTRLAQAIANAIAGYFDAVDP